MPRVLAITPHVPLPLRSGDTIRYYNLIVQLARHGWDVSLFSLCMHDAPEEADLQALRAICDDVIIEPFRKPKTRKHLDFAKDSLSRRPFHDHLFWSETAQATFDRSVDLDTFDIVFVHLIHMYRYVCGRAKDATVFDTHNAEFLRLRSMIEGNPWSLRALFARTQLGPVRSFEMQAVREAACTLAVSTDDYDYFQSLSPNCVELVPNGVDLELHYPKADVTSDPNLLFLASLSYSANLDSLHYLINSILPLCQRKDAHLDVVGSKPPPSLAQICSAAPIHANAVGEVRDTRPYIDRNRILVVPLRFGGGTRLKILEALAQGLPVISTSIGCSGLGLRHQEEIIIADDPEEFAGWIDRLLADTDLCRTLSRNGRQKVERDFGWDRIGETLHSILEDITHRRLEKVN